MHDYLKFYGHDVRICHGLKGFHKLSACSRFENLWSGYVEFRERVKNATPREFRLRDQDRYLWGNQPLINLRETLTESSIKKA